MKHFHHAMTVGVIVFIETDHLVNKGRIKATIWFRFKVELPGCAGPLLKHVSWRCL